MNYRFDEWDIQAVHEPNELMQKLNEMNLIGKKIKSINCVGMCYNLTKEMIETYAYEYYEKIKSPAECEEFAKYYNIPFSTPFERNVEIDKPIIIFFEDGDRLEIDYSEARYLKIGKNSLPSDMKNSNADMNIVFSNCIGSTVTGFDIEKQDNAISKFRINLDNDTYLKFDNYMSHYTVSVCSKETNTTIL